MSHVALRTPVRFGTSFLQQLRLIGWSGRWMVPTLALLLLLVLTGAVQAEVTFGLPRVMVAAMLGLPVAAPWALLVWHGELPYRRGYHWSLPVPRAGHDLARVAVGAVFLVGAYALLAAVGAALAARSGDWEGLTSSGSPWITFFAGPLVLYLLAMPFALWSDSPALRRGMIAFFAVGFAAMLLDFEAYAGAMEHVFGRGWGITTALLGGFLRQSGEVTGPPGEGTVAALWLTLGAVATVCAAIFRPDAMARRVRRT